LVASSSLAQPIKFVLKINDLLNGKSFFSPTISRTHQYSACVEANREVSVQYKQISLLPILEGSK